MTILFGVIAILTKDYLVINHIIDIIVSVTFFLGVIVITQKYYGVTNMVNYQLAFGQKLQ